MDINNFIFTLTNELNKNLFYNIEIDKNYNNYDKTYLIHIIADKDNKRYEELLREHGIKTFVVWELDYNKSFNINDLLKSIEEYYILNHEN